MTYIKIFAINIFIPARTEYFQNQKYKLKIRKFWVHSDLKFSTSVTTKKSIYLFGFLYMHACVCWDSHVTGYVWRSGDNL